MERGESLVWFLNELVCFEQIILLNNSLTHSSLIKSLAVNFPDSSSQIRGPEINGVCIVSKHTTVLSMR